MREIKESEESMEFLVSISGGLFEVLAFTL